MAKRGVLLFIALICTACAMETPTPSPRNVYTIATTPELETLVTSWLEAYQEVNQQTLLQIDIVSPQILQTASENQNADLIISSFPPPADWFATPLFSEEITVVVNSSNDLQILQTTDLALLFSGKLQSWADLGWRDETVQPVVPLEEEASRKKFQEIILHGSPFALTSLLAPTPTFVRQYIQENPGGIGFLLKSNMTEEVQELTLSGDGSSQGNLDQRLLLEILAMWSKEPHDDLHVFLAWLQGSYLQ